MKRTNTKDRDRKSTLISVAVVVAVELLYLAPCGPGCCPCWRGCLWRR